MGIIGDRIITAKGTTVRLPDAETGDEDWSMADADNTAQVRSIDGTTASARDIEAGHVAVLRDGEVSVVRGALNARGTEPVITDKWEYAGPDGTTESLKHTQAVLAAMPKGLVLLQSSNKIVTEETTVELASPEVDAVITQAIRATDDRAIMVWSRGDPRWLTTHELSSGGVQLQEDIDAAEATVRLGIVWISWNQTLSGDEIHPVCQGGEQVTATIICPGLMARNPPMAPRSIPNVPTPFYRATPSTQASSRPEGTTDETPQILATAVLASAPTIGPIIAGSAVEPPGQVAAETPVLATESVVKASAAQAGLFTGLSTKPTAQEPFVLKPKITLHGGLGNAQASTARTAPATAPASNPRQISAGATGHRSADPVTWAQGTSLLAGAGLLARTALTARRAQTE